MTVDRYSGRYVDRQLTEISADTLIDPPKDTLSKISIKRLQDFLLLVYQCANEEKI